MYSRHTQQLSDAAYTDENGKHLHFDILTELMDRRSFCIVVDRALSADPQGAAEGRYAVICFDVLRFKAINELFGTKRGDRLLSHIAEVITESLGEGEYACRISADNFAVFMRAADDAPRRLLNRLSEAIARDLPFETTFNAGVYVTCAEQLNADAMLDRAKLALASIKGNYAVKYKYYTESLRSEMLSEHEIEGMSAQALRNHQFKVYYQPQHSHATGMLTGAEALVRWEHPERGMILPGKFVPIFERNGFITTLDLYVFEQACAMQRRCMDSGLKPVPISTNFSRYDIFQDDFLSSLERIRIRWGVPVKYLHIELTETVFIDGSQRMNHVVDELHRLGYKIQMDDFGSGYSSLNVLKDTDVDCFKLDMGFLSGGADETRGGIILSTVVRMAKWLVVQVIAEGVETLEQADFLRSIGCDCMQGFLYARPLEEEEYLGRLAAQPGQALRQTQESEALLSADFWNPYSLETLIFSRYAGAAAIFEYKNEKVEILRVNEKYVEELGMNQTEKELIESDPLSVFDEENRSAYLHMLEEAIRTHEEQECVTWRTLSSDCCGEERCYVRANVRLISKNANGYLFYAMIRNITSERRRYDEILDNERRFMIASEQVNIYYWEYNIATHEMRPCFRCMRDLGLPAVLPNYPESAFERGVFPPEIHDLYRSWHRQVAAGVPELEAIMPLTMDRIPFRVRYTTEFDEHGRPVKAYGSAALVKDAAARPAELEKSNAENERALQLIAQHSDRVVLHYDLEKGSIRFYDELSDQYGMNNSTIASLFDEGRIMPESRENAMRVLRNIRRGIPYGREEIRFKYRDNYYCWLDFKYTTLFDENKKPVGAFLSYVDITDKVEAMERSRIDGMTGLLNRATVEKRIRALVESQNVRPGILMLLDIDSLKSINDTLGHHEGDKAIGCVAETLKKHFRSSDVVGRFGGDEFAVYLEEAAVSRAAIERSMCVLLKKISDISVGEGKDAMRVRCSIGCAVQMEAETFDSFYKRADAALYAVKRHGKNRLAFFEEGMEGGAHPL